MIRVVALAALLLAPPAALAEGGPRADPERVRLCRDGAGAGDTTPSCIGAAAGACQEAAGGATTAGIMACLDSETAAWDAMLNEEYGLLRGDLRAEDAAAAGKSLVSRSDAMRDAQRAWIAFRDADCALRWSMWQDGTIRGPVAARCLLDHTARRTLELRDLRRDGEGSL